jgi:hypothetical protein
MKSEEFDKSELVASILNIEMDMFLSVTADDVYTCQQSPNAFLLHRKAQFDSWDCVTIQSYLEDLKDAQANGINLMTIKYAYMDGNLPRPKMIPTITSIVDYLYYWQCEMFRKYPALMKGARALEEDSQETTSFKTYLTGELCTYSIRTLNHLLAYISNLALEGKNLSEMIYENVLQANGFKSIQDYIDHSQGNKIK